MLGILILREKWPVVEYKGSQIAEGNFCSKPQINLRQVFTS